MPPRPYRTYLRTIDPSQLQAMSIAAGRAKDPYRPYDEEWALIVEWENKTEKPPSALFSRWSMHPDERVRAELVRSRKTYRWIDKSSHWTGSIAWRNWTQAFLDRMITDMRAERVWWTPLLDAVAGADWPTRGPVVSAAVKGLAPWLQTQATQNDVREMLQAFRGEEIRKAVLMHAGCIDQTFAREIYEHLPETHLISALAQNPSLSADVVAAIAEWIVDDWEANVRNAPAIRAFTGGNFIALLRQHRSTVPVHAIRRVYALPKIAYDLDMPSLDPGKPVSSSTDQKHTTSRNVALYELRFLSDRIAQEELTVPSDVLCAVVPFVQQENRKLLDLLRHPNADVTVWRTVLSQTRTLEVCLRAARNLELRRDPEICDHLLRSGLWEVLALLAEDADPRIAGDAIRGLIALNELGRAAQILADRDFERSIALKPEDLTPLLRSNDPNIRLAAITTLGRLQNRMQSTTPDPESPRPTRIEARPTTR